MRSGGETCGSARRVGELDATADTDAAMLVERQTVG
jgi:hypothetical protein